MNYKIINLSYSRRLNLKARMIEGSSTPKSADVVTDLPDRKRKASTLTEEEKKVAKANKKEEKAALKILRDQEKENQKRLNKEKRQKETAARQTVREEEKFWNRLDLTSYSMQKTPEELTEAIKHRPDLLEDRDKAGHTPLICAAAFGKSANVLVLLEHGANVEAKDKHNETAIIHAVSRGAESYTESLKHLIKYGANLNVCSTDLGKNALMHAAGGGYNPCLDSLKLLIAAGADATIKDKIGKTALDWAKERGTPETVEVLENIDNYRQAVEKEVE